MSREHYTVTKIQGDRPPYRGGRGDMEPKYVDITAESQDGNEYEFRVTSAESRAYYIGKALTVKHGSESSL